MHAFWRSSNVAQTPGTWIILPYLHLRVHLITSKQKNNKKMNVSISRQVEIVNSMRDRILAWIPSKVVNCHAYSIVLVSYSSKNILSILHFRLLFLVRNIDSITFHYNGTNTTRSRPMIGNFSLSGHGTHGRVYPCYFFGISKSSSIQYDTKFLVYWPY